LRAEKFGKVFLMEALKEYTVPLTGLKPGNHVYQFEVGSDFFKHFENSPIERGRFTASITLDRQPNLAVVNFQIEGAYECVCDRCLVQIELPVTYDDQLILKFEEGEDTDEVLYLDPQASEWNASKVIFELICLGKPLMNVYDCQGIPCDAVMLKKLTEFEVKTDIDESVWKDLKNIKLN